MSNAFTDLMHARKLERVKEELSETYASGAVHFIVSDTQPTQTTVNGKPVVWINTSTPLTSVTPTAPTFTDLGGTASDTYTIPATTGVDYQVGGVTKAAGTYVGSGSVTVTAVAQAGYTLTGTTTWTNTFSTAETAASPATIGSLFALYDASATGALTVSGTAVSSWNDTSGNARHAVQATTANQPDQVTLNGLAAVKFTAANSDRVRYSATWSLPKDPGYTICGVARFDAQPTGTGTLLSLVGAQIVRSSSGGMLGTSSTSASKAGGAVGATAFYALRVTATGVKLWVGGTDPVSATGATFDISNNIALGAAYGGAVGVDPADVTIGEAWVHSKALTDSEVAQLHAYVQNKWGAL